MRPLNLAAFLLTALLASPVTFAEPIEEGFQSLQPNGTSDGWAKGVFVTEDGYLDGDGRYLAKEFGDFVLRFDFRLKPGANSGVGIRTAKTGNPAYNGMEIQVLDHNDKRYANIKPWQCHGSVYGVVAAKRGALKGPGEWNTEEIRAEGDHITVTLNGTVIVDTKLSEVAKKDGTGTIDGGKHPGLFRESGYIALCGHGGGVQFRNMRIKSLNDPAAAADNTDTATDSE